jgi:hypothetical protein
MLIDAASIAIWNGNKVVVPLAIAVWCTNVAFHLHCESCCLCPRAEDMEYHLNLVW